MWYPLPSFDGLKPAATPPLGHPVAARFNLQSRGTWRYVRGVEPRSIGHQRTISAVLLISGLRCRALCCWPALFRAAYGERGFRLFMRPRLGHVPKDCVQNEKAANG